MTKFEEIAKEAIKRAEKVKCALPEYRDGLKAIIETLQERYEMVKEEVGGD